MHIGQGAGRGGPSARIRMVSLELMFAFDYWIII